MVYKLGDVSYDGGVLRDAKLPRKVGSWRRKNRLRINSAVDYKYLLLFNTRFNENSGNSMRDSNESRGSSIFPAIESAPSR